jgi:2-polyprenyl-3-methyl-5-hydroxy-6-metoxy-1,4-benzoquinol methylase
MARWCEVSKDPNSVAAQAWRAETVRQAHAEPVDDRNAYLAGLVRGKHVLDVGCVDHTMEAAGNAGWLHGRLRAAAKTCLGVDVLTEEVEALREKGFDVCVRDITVDPFPDRKFDVIICGELVEHLGNPGDLFAAAGGMLAPSGLLVLTTPNPYYLAVVGRALRGVFPGNVDHVSLFSPPNLAELAERSGMAIRRWRGVRVWPSMVSVRRRKSLWAASGLVRMGALAPEALCRTIICEFTLGPVGPAGGEGGA